jgi:hypothetical protein
VDFTQPNPCQQGRRQGRRNVQKRSQEQLKAANGNLAFFTERASNRGRLGAAGRQDWMRQSPKNPQFTSKLPVIAFGR